MRSGIALVAGIMAASSSPAHLTSGPTGPTAGDLLDHRAILTRQTFLDNRDFDWYQRNIPFFDSPDSDVNSTYYYRWQLVTRHLTYGSPASGYSFTEFIDRPFWSGAFGSISCPLGHQMYEVRWLKDRRIVDDFARYWFETPGAEPRSYSNWYGDAVWATYLVNGDHRFIAAMFPHMIAQYDGWLHERWDSGHGMFHWDGLHDGMEVNINSRLTSDPGAGADGYRPTLNSYLFADARAIARAAALLGDTAVARQYSTRAAALKRRVEQQLWDSSRTFFFHQFAHDEQHGVRAGTLTYRSGPYAGNRHGREEIGLVPWQFDLPDPGYETAWRFVMDTAYFFSKYGPTTVERHDPQFEISPHCCVWSGNEWPYATTQTLIAMANLLDNYHQHVVTPQDYFRLFKTYTLDQRKNGRPYIAEAANPDNGSWAGHDTFDHSEDYFHSGYVDLVITGVIGLRPRADDSVEVAPLAPASWDHFAIEGVGYHGHTLAIYWDRDGSYYRHGAGLTIADGGRVVAHATRLGRLVGNLGPAIEPPPVERASDVAVNNGHAPYPLVTASYSAPGTSPHYLVDGNYWYNTDPPNRWTTEGSGHGTDWVSVDFGIERAVDSVDLYFLDDGSGVRAPARYSVEMRQGGRWVEVPDQRRSPARPEGHRANVVRFPRVSTTGFEVVLDHQPHAASGLTEIQAWSASPLPLAAATASPRNFAWGARATASFTSRYDSVEEVNDMVVAFSRYSRNRWTSFGSRNASDWIELDFLTAHLVGMVELYLWGDGAGTRAPKDYTIQFDRAGRWVDATVRSREPDRPRTSSVNTIRIAPVETAKLRVIFRHDSPAATGVTEIMIRGDDR
ncbi:MAG: MGH1-like glycoside hydrolase domain-containing protein [Gemmatimonadales bacterium]